MKSAIWWIFFVVVVFGVGWTSNSLTQQFVDPDAVPVVRRDSERRRHHRGYYGPDIRSLEELEEVLQLSEEQKEELEALKQQTIAEIQALESDTRKIIRGTKAKTQAILTEAQRNTLKEHNLRQLDIWRKRKVERQEEWLAKQTQLPEAELARAVKIIDQHEKDVHALLNTWREAEQETPWEERRAELQRLMTQRDQFLGAILPPEDLERFQNSGIDRRRYGGDRGRRRGKSGHDFPGKGRRRESRPKE